MMSARAAEPFDDTPLECALTYAQCGLRVLPIKPGEKRPPMPAWQDAATTDRATINNWFRGLYIDHGVGLAMGPQPDGRMVFAVDVDEHDPSRSGSETLQELERQHGKLPDTVRAITGADGVHLLFTATTEIRNGNIGDGVDIRGHGGQIVVYPTIHPTTSRRYEWEAGCAPWEHTIAEAPDWLIDLVKPSEPRPAESAPPRSSTGTTPADHLRNGWDWCAELTKAGWTLHHSETNGDTHWTRPGKDRREGASAVLHAPDGPFNVFTTDASTADLRRLGKPGGAGLVSISPFDFYTAIRHGGDVATASRTIRLTMPEVELTIRPSNVDPTTGEVTVKPSEINLPEDFWTARTELTHIRQAAHCRARSGDAVLLFTLARLAATIPPCIVLPGILGGIGSLNFFGAIIGTSGSGKSTAGDVARELAPIDRTDVLADVSMGSGEGLIEAYFDWVMEEQADGKTKKVKRKTRDGLYMYLDEGQALGQMAGRKGSVLMETLRSAWAGQGLGQTNASEETKRQIVRHTYRLALMVGFQVEHADGLLADAAGGTPQRFLFASAVDATVPYESPEWPGALDMSPPAISGQKEIPIATPVAAEIRSRGVAATRGDITLAELDSHRNFVRLRTAALLGYLDNRLDVNEEDWQLAGVMVDTSDAVRRWVAAAARERAQRDEIASHIRAARREEFIADKVVSSALKRAARAIGRRAQKVEELTRRDAAQAIKGTDRKVVDVDDAIEKALKMEWIEAIGGGWKAGKSVPL